MTISRTKKLRLELSDVTAGAITQQAFGRWLRASQSTVNDYESGKPESGPASFLLDQLEALIARDGVAAARAMVLSGSLFPLSPPSAASLDPAADSSSGSGCTAEPEAFSSMRHEAGFARGA